MTYLVLRTDNTYETIWNHMFKPSINGLSDHRSSGHDGYKHKGYAICVRYGNAWTTRHVSSCSQTGCTVIDSGRYFQYLFYCTRQYLSYIFRKRGAGNHAPNQRQCEMLKSTILYVQGTKKYGIQ